MIERLRFHCGTASVSEVTMPGPWSGWWLGIVTLRRPECSVRWTRFEHYRDPGRPRSFDHLARCAAGRFQSREGLAHHTGAAFGEWDQVLTQPVDVLLHRQATNFAVTIPEPDTRPVAPKELSLPCGIGMDGVCELLEESLSDGLLRRAERGKERRVELLQVRRFIKDRLDSLPGFRFHHRHARRRRDERSRLDAH